MRGLLLIAIAVLGAALYLQWAVVPQTAPTRPPPRVGQVDAVSQAGAEGDVFSNPLGPAQDFEVIAARTLFEPDRRPDQGESEAVDVGSTATPLDGLDLRSVLITPQVSTAWVREKGEAKDIALKPGDSIRGWTVQRIERDALYLEAGEEKSSIDLREFPEHAAPPAATPAVKPNVQLPVARKPQQRRVPPNRRPVKE
jgi:hypothetical protein